MYKCKAMEIPKNTKLLKEFENEYGERWKLVIDSKDNLFIGGDDVDWDYEPIKIAEIPFTNNIFIESKWLLNSYEKSIIYSSYINKERLYANSNT